MTTKNSQLTSVWLLLLSLLLFSMLYLLFFAIGGAAVWYACVLAKMKLTYPYTLPYHLPSPFIVVLLFGGLLLIWKMLGSLVAIRKIHRPDLQEITKTEYPDLFALIDEITDAMQVKKPTHVYLSATPTASIFLKTGFWNAFFPSKKQLEIGMGLVQFLNQEELKAVLAHEFGHFSQHSTFLNAPIYAVGQSIQYLVQKVQLKKRGTFEDQYYIFATLFRTLTDVLFTKLSKKFHSLSVEMEYEADRLAAEYVGYEALISALLKSSFAVQMFNRTLNNLGILAQSQKAITDFYTAQYYTAAYFLQVKQIQWSNDFIIHSMPDVLLSKLTKQRLEKLHLFTNPDISKHQEIINPAIKLFPLFEKKAIWQTQQIYKNQLNINSSKLSICTPSKYGNWFFKYFSQLEILEKSNKEVEIEIVMEANLHRAPLIDASFYVYWDNEKIGKGKYKKGISLKVSTSTGKHYLKIEGEAIKYQPITITIENTHKHIIYLDYKHFLWKAEYCFFVTEIKNHIN